MFFSILIGIYYMYLLQIFQTCFTIHSLSIRVYSQNYTFFLNCLLRANGKSFVCDVNGFSFVKNSNKYYDDCAKILGNMILRELAPTLHIPWSVPFQLDDPPIVPTTFGKMMELRCVVAVIRHGDRTPKQKMKVEVRHPR